MHDRLTDFWKRPFVQNVLPFVSSVALHLTIILMVLATYRAIEIAWDEPRDQIIIPDAAIVDQADIGGVPSPGLGDLTPPGFDQSAADAREWLTSPPAELAGGQSAFGDQDVSLAVIGVGIGAAGSLSTDAAAPGARFGVPGGGDGLGPPAPFMGHGGNARTVIYVCRASGRMVGEPWRLLQQELKRAVDVLRPIQSFNVILFGEDRVVALGPNDLLVANPRNQRAAYDFVDSARVGGHTLAVLEALELALKQRPDLIYFLADGHLEPPWGPGNQRVIDFIRQHNPDGRSRINTIAFLNEEDREERDAAERVLRTIAEENGGVYRYVSPESLRR